VHTTPQSRHMHTGWYANGQRYYIHNYHLDQPHDLWQGWHANGQLDYSRT
jgi:antitoxin component YwqK of YwqJK toxin-antitoxin module